MKKLLTALLLWAGLLSADSPRIRALYHGLDPSSVAQHLAFYDLFPNSKEGEKALHEAWKLLGGADEANPCLSSLQSLADAVPAMIDLVQGRAGQLPTLTDAQLAVMNQLGSPLANRRLKGYGITSEQELFSIDQGEIDLSRALLITQLGSFNEHRSEILSYEALIDLMALQVRAKLKGAKSPEAKITAINELLFHDLWFRFPPHSQYAENIDLYTFLPAVLDSRRGVCLGISTLYLCLAQRLNLELEVVTPPGHIYVRYRHRDKTINIETTARGCHFDDERYLGINTRALQKRELWEVIGMAFFNQASLYWQENNPEKVRDTYLATQRYLPEDRLTKQFLSFALVCCGQEEEGRVLMKEIADWIPEESVFGNSIARDFLDGKVDRTGIEAVLSHVDETRASIDRKRLALEAVVNKFPEFRAGWFYLAVTWLQLHRSREGLEALTRYHELEPNDPSAEYYLSSVHFERFHFPLAWDHYLQAESLVDHNPGALKELRRALQYASPKLR